MMVRNQAADLELVKLEPGMFVKDVEETCRVAIRSGLAAICLPTLFAKIARTLLKDSGVQLITCIGFPYGYQPTESKLAEMVLALVDGVDEVEVLVNYTAIKNDDWHFTANEINHLLPIVRNANKKLTVVLETSMLSRQQIIKCCELYSTAEVDGIAVNTGTCTPVPALEHLSFIRELLPSTMKYKCSVPTLTLAEMDDFVRAGINRIGVVQLPSFITSPES